MFKEPNPEYFGYPILKIDKWGTKRWFLNGFLHRGDGPAIEWFDGSKSWYLNNKLHRTDGPACEFSSGYKSWWLNGKYYTEQEFWEEVKYNNFGRK